MAGVSKVTNKTFIEKAKSVHGNKYDYSIVNYITSKTKVDIVCSKHGVFSQRPNCHLNGAGCKLCGVDARSYDRQIVLANTVPKGARAVFLTRGIYCLVDDDNYTQVNKYRWIAHKRPNGKYDAITTIRENGEKYNLMMSRFIMGVTEKNLQVDHIDQNTMDNRKSNLRVCTRSQNCMNRKSNSVTSKYKGVYWYPLRKRWRSAIQFQLNGKSKRIGVGYFKCEIEAAKAYDAKAREVHGEFAYLNFP